MACPSFASTSNVRLYWAIDPDPSIAFGSGILDGNSDTGTGGGSATGTLVWHPIRFTGESFDLNLTSTISDEITVARSYANSLITQGEVTGGFNFELSFSSFDPFLIGLTQDDTATINQWSGAITGFGTTDYLQNGSTSKCFMFLKEVDVGGVTYTFSYRGCQVDQMTMSIQPASLITGSFSFQGVGGAFHPWDEGVTGIQDMDDLWGTAAGGSNGHGGAWEKSTAGTNPLMSGVYSVPSIVFKEDSAAGADISTTFQGIDITVSNQLRQQQGVGGGTPYALGVASGRFQASMNTNQYFASPSVYKKFIADGVIYMSFDTEDSSATPDKYTWRIEKLKVQSGTVPLAGGPDQDMMIAPVLQAFEGDTTGTLRITKTIGV